MSQSSPGSLLATVGFFLGVAITGVYAINNRDLLADFASKNLTGVPGTADPAAQARNGNGASSSPQRQAEPSGGGDFELKANSNGHFEALADINGGDVDVMIDTGATLVALTYEDAERAGLILGEADFTEKVQTANGLAKIALVTLDRISIGDITLRNVEGAVAEQGKLHKTLLGMSFLGRLSRVEMGPKTLSLHE